MKYDVSSTAACSTLPDYMGNIWDNYYFVKLPIVEEISTRYTTADTAIDQVIVDLAAINTTFTEVMRNLTAIVDGVTDP